MGIYNDNAPAFVVFYMSTCFTLVIILGCQPLFFKYKTEPNKKSHKRNHKANESTKNN